MSMARLVIFDETVRGVDLGSRTVVLGRSKKVDIPIRDHLLSRKHCSIVPATSGFRLLDLRSSNGTFLNGERVDEKELHPDDIIEVGNTVMVLLDTDSWQRGSGLPRLRNPAKAKELIRAIRKRDVRGKNGDPADVAGAEKPPPRAPFIRQKKVLTEKEREFFDWASRELLRRPVGLDLLEGYVSYQIATLLVRHTPELGDVLSSVMENVLQEEHYGGDLASLRETIRASLRELLARSGEDSEHEDADEP
jgi:hypothetical protein